MNNTTRDTPVTHVTWVGIREAADRLGVHPETLRRWDKAGTLPASRTPGGVRRFRSVDVDAILSSRSA